MYVGDFAMQKKTASILHCKDRLKDRGRASSGRLQMKNGQDLRLARFSAIKLSAGYQRR